MIKDFLPSEGERLVARIAVATLLFIVSALFYPKILAFAVLIIFFLLLAALLWSAFAPIKEGINQRK